MPGGLEDHSDDDAYRPPLPPQDRVWRHPSEFASGASADAGTNVVSSSTHLRSVLTLGATAALVVVAVVLVGGALELSKERAAEPTGAARLTSGSIHPTTFVPTTQLASTTTVTAAPKARLGIAGIDTSVGVVVTECTVGGAAAAAGLRPGDVLVSVGRQPVARMAEVSAALAQIPPGEHVTVTVRRGGTSLDLDITLGTRA